MMKALLAVLLLAAPALGQDQAAAAMAAAGCGPHETEFSVKTSKKQRPLPQAQPGKAVVAVLAEFPKLCVGGCITSRVAVDGTWMGANKGRSYFFFAVAPGEHRVCTAQQSKLAPLSERAAALTLTAEAGEIYYFRVIFINNELVLKTVDGAEWPLLLKSSPYSTSKVTKP
ncbi:MAG: DUF2846 domain-containing protein [Candidatus Acidiferrales bacterium]